MGPLVKKVKKQLAGLGGVADGLALLQRALPSGESEEVARRLPQLLEGDTEAVDFFFAEVRRDIVAQVLGAGVEELERLQEEQREFRVLVLDRSLDLATRRYLKRRQSKHEERFAVVEPEDDSIESFCEAARGVPGALVVLAEGGDPTRFGEAGLETTSVHWYRRGYVLDSMPELVPLPPAPPPRLVDDDGMPLVPLEALEEELLQAEPSEEQDRVKSIVEQGGIATFSIAQVISFLTRELEDGSVRWVDDPSHLEGPSLFSRWLAREPETLVWAHLGELFFIGEEVESVLGPISEHHALRRPGSFRDAVDQLDRLNPFLCVADGDEPRFSGAWEEARAAVLEECGVDIIEALEGWAARVEAKAAPHRVLVGRSTALDKKARASLEALASRPMSFEVADAFLHFAIRRLARVPLVVIPPENADLFHVVADLGGGRLLWVRALFFADEQPRPLHHFGQGAPWEGYQDAINLDGGDVHLWLKLQRTAWLAETQGPDGPEEALS